MAELSRIKAELALLLPPKRYKHSSGVAATARRLAKQHGLDEALAEQTGWLHDCAKALPAAEAEKQLGVSGADKEERATPALWHAPLGAWMAKARFGFRHKGALKAIRFHSTGAPGQDKFGRLIFVADYIEPNRPAWPELPALRRLARRNLDAAFLEVVRQKLIDLLKRGKRLHPRSVLAWEDALKKYS